MIDKKFCVALVECGEWKVILMQLEKAISIKSVYMVKCETESFLGNSIPTLCKKMCIFNEKKMLLEIEMISWHHHNGLLIYSKGPRESNEIWRKFKVSASKVCLENWREKFHDNKKICWNCLYLCNLCIETMLILNILSKFGFWK